MKVGRKTLVLNKFYFPIGVEGVERTFGNIFSNSVVPLDISYEIDCNNNINFNSVEYFTAVQSIDEWLSLPIRPYDEYIQTVRGPVRVPQVVVCTSFDKIIYNRVQFPTKQNIYRRDKFTCVYTGRKLSQDELSVDHVVPRCRGGADTWENLVTCTRSLNSKKSDKSPEEVGLKLRYKPYRPTNGLVLEVYKDEWCSFLKNM